MAERLNGAGFEKKALAQDKLVLIDFYSDSCIPCKKMSPVLAEVEEKYQDRIFVGKVNVAYEQELVQMFQVQSAPTFLFFKKGEVIERLTGAQKKEKLEEIIESNI